MNRIRIQKRKYESSKKKMQTKKSGRKNSVKKLFSTKNTTGTDFQLKIARKRLLQILKRSVKIYLKIEKKS